MEVIVVYDSVEREFHILANTLDNVAIVDKKFGSQNDTGRVRIRVEKLPLTLSIRPEVEVLLYGDPFGIPV